MKIAIVAQPFDFIPPTGGGSIALWVDEVSSRLARDHQVSVYCRAGRNAPAEQMHDRVRIVRVLTSLDEKLIEAIKRIERGLKKYLGIDRDLFYRYHYFSRAYYSRYIASISKLIRSDGADVIIVPNFSQFAPSLRRHNPDKKIVVVMQCDWLIEMDPDVVARRLDQIDVVCGCSAYISNGVARSFPRHAHKCFPLHNATDPDVFSRGLDQEKEAAELRARLDLDGKTVVTFVGRVAPEKGVHVLLKAMRQVAETRPEVVLLVVGNVSPQPPSPKWVLRRDPEFAEFEELKHRYKEHLQDLSIDVDKAVRFIGNVPHYDLAPYYNVSDIFVHPSIWNEPFGMILTEAMACARPVISTKAGGIPEVVADGETGLLVERGDPEGLAMAILDLASDKDRRISMGANGKARMLSNFTWDHTVARLNEILGREEATTGAATVRKSPHG